MNKFFHYLNLILGKAKETKKNIMDILENYKKTRSFGASSEGKEKPNKIQKKKNTAQKVERYYEDDIDNFWG